MAFSGVAVLVAVFETRVTESVKESVAKLMSRPGRNNVIRDPAGHPNKKNDQCKVLIPGR